MTKLIVAFRDFTNAPGNGQKSRGAEERDRERERDAGQKGWKDN
jgi:hypothetical protein